MANSTLATVIRDQLYGHSLSDDNHHDQNNEDSMDNIGYFVNCKLLLFMPDALGHSGRTVVGHRWAKRTCCHQQKLSDEDDTTTITREPILLRSYVSAEKCSR